MKIALGSALPVEAKADLLALACDEDSLAENPQIDAIDRALGGALRRAIAEESFRANSGQVLMQHTQGKIPAARVALVGLGARTHFVSASLRFFAGRAAKLASNVGATSLALAVAPALGTESRPPEAARAVFLTEGILLGSYRFDKYLSSDKRQGRSLASVDLLLGPATAEGADAIALGERLAAAVAQARDLVNEPAGTLTPSALADVARSIAATHKLEIKVLDADACRAQGMELFLAVSQGSTEPPRFIHMAHKPKNARKRVVLIGKGITFDSGGLSLKPNDSMLDMKTDMAGAATVLSAMAVIAQEQLPIEVHALAACCENMPSGRAYKLGDVIRGKGGKTVEINNTDAEGRLTLADAMAYALELQPDVVLDFATLTGAVVVALGPHTAGVLSNNDALCAQWLAAAKAVGEDMWQLPLSDRLHEQLKSEIADMKNTGERWGGAITAGLFLKEFIGNVPWVHVDLAGPSSTDKEWGAIPKGGTGFGLLTIVEYLRIISGSISAK